MLFVVVCFGACCAVFYYCYDDSMRESVDNLLRQLAQALTDLWNPSPEDAELPELPKVHE